MLASWPNPNISDYLTTHMNHVKEVTRTVPERRGLPSYLIIHMIRCTYLYRLHSRSDYARRDREPTRYELYTIMPAHIILSLTFQVITHILLCIVTYLLHYVFLLCWLPRWKTTSWNHVTILSLTYAVKLEALRRLTSWHAAIRTAFGPSHITEKTRGSKDTTWTVTHHREDTQL